MAEVNCNACDELKNEVPELIVNGLDDNMCTSLKNNMGLKPSSGHDDFTDIGNLNDCLIGNKAVEIDTVDVCDLKDFLRDLIGNIWTTIKAINCAISGLWTKIDSISITMNTATTDGYVEKGGSHPNKVWKTDENGNPAWRDDDTGEIEDICDLIGASIAPPFEVVGRCPLITPTSVGIYDAGTAPSSKIRFRDESELNPYTKDRQGIGIHYAQLETTDCKTGECKVYEWIYPKSFEVYIKDGVQKGDVLWYISKSDLQAIVGFSDYLWRLFTESAWTWRETPIRNGASNHKFAYLTLTVNPGERGNDYIGIEYAGTSYPDESTVSYDMRVTDMTNAPRLYTHICGEN